MAVNVVAGRYRLDHRLAGGAMGEVWEAEDLELDRRVALKLLGPGADPARFEREAHAAASLAHPNICQVYDYGEVDDRPFMVLEFLPGGTLEERLRPGKPLPDGDTLRILTQLADGLAHAHERGLVHRDLKPANVLFDEEGRAKIADFGIARRGDASTLTEAGTVLGTAAYISPEQVAGEPSTAASDVYSLGVIAYRLITGRLPFESESAFELARMHRDAAPPPLAGIRPDAPPRLEHATMAALRKRPSERPPDGAAFLAALGGAAAPGPTATTAVTQSIRPTLSGFSRRRRLLAALAAAVVLVAAGLVLALTVTHGRASKTTPPRRHPTHQSTATAPMTSAATSSTTPSTSTEATTTQAQTTSVVSITLPTTAPPVSTSIPTPTIPTTTTTG